MLLPTSRLGDLLDLLLEILLGALDIGHRRIERVTVHTVYEAMERSCSIQVVR